MVASLSQQHTGAPTHGDAQAFRFKVKSRSENEQNILVCYCGPDCYTLSSVAWDKIPQGSEQQQTEEESVVAVGRSVRSATH